MIPTVEFDSVSKQYNLGLTRTSLLRGIYKSARSVLASDDIADTDQQVLWALRDVNFKLTAGDSLALIGHNGAGKTTTLRLLSNITHPTSGRVTVNGRLSALIELGAGFHPDLTGRENIFLNGTILGLKREEIARRFDEIVAFSEIERFIDTPVKRYSSGMNVRLGFAVASCIEPDVLLVDEVLAVGDASFRQKCMKRIQAMQNSGTTIIFVSHNMYLVQAVCKSALYMEHGQVKFAGPTAEAIDLYERDVHEQNARKFDLAQSAEADTSTSVQISRVEVANRDGIVEQDFLSQQAAEIRLHYHATQDIPDANAVIRIFRADGVTCCMMRTSLDNVRLPLHGGQGTITLSLTPLQLITSAYFIDARITDATDSLVLASGRSPWFNVKGRGLSHEEQSGIFEPNATWNHNSSSPNGRLHEDTLTVPLAVEGASVSANNSAVPA